MVELYTGNLLVYVDGEISVNLQSTGVPVPFTRDIRCEGGGNAAFAGEAVLYRDDRMEVSGTMTSEGCRIRLRVCRRTVGQGGFLNLDMIWSDCTWETYLMSLDRAELVQKNTVLIRASGTWRLDGTLSGPFAWRITREDGADRAGNCEIQTEIGGSVGRFGATPIIVEGTLCGENIKLQLPLTPRLP